MRHGTIRFRPDADGGTPPIGGGAPPEPPTPDPPDDGKGAPPDPEKTFTQAELDAIVARAKRQAEKKTREELEAEAQRAAMTENERLKAEREEADRQAAEAKAERDRILVEAEAKVAALAAGIPQARLEKALRLLDLSHVEVEDGSIDAKAIAGAVEALKREIPELFASGTPPRSGGDFQKGEGGKRTWTAAEVKAMAPTEYAKHRDDIMAAISEGRYVD